jgi:glutamine cyclotransferase
MHRASLARVAVALSAVVVMVVGCSSSSGPSGPEVTADLTVTPVVGTVITDFTFDAGGSSSQGRALEYRWDWENDGVWDTDWSSESVVVHRFVSGDTLTTRVQVRDGSTIDGATAVIDLDDRHGTVVERITLPGWVIARDLTCDGENMWVTSWSHPTLKLDLASGDSLGTIPGNSAWTGGIAWDGEYVWTAGWQGASKLFKQDPVDGTVLGSFPVVYSGHSGGLDWNGEVFFYGSSTTDTQGDGLVHVYTAQGANLYSFACPRGSTHPRGLAYDGRDLWVTTSDADTLYVVDANDGTVLRAMPFPEPSEEPMGQGLVVVGDYVWMIAGTGMPGDIIRMVP